MKKKHQTKLYLDSNLQDPEIVNLAKGTLAVLCQRGPDKRQNEDAAVIIPVTATSMVIAVADGAGGHPQGDVAARIAVSSVKREVEKLTNGNLRPAILDAFENANKEIMKLGTGAATTLMVAEICDNVMRTYHAGDSIALVNGARGKEKYRTVSHNPSELGIEAGLIEEIDYNDPDHYSTVTNLLGMSDMRIEIGSSFQLAPQDTILLASDGLTDNIISSTLGQILKKRKLTSVAEELKSECLQNMEMPPLEGPSKPDDLTFILYRQVS